MVWVPVSLYTGPHANGAATDQQCISLHTHASLTDGSISPPWQQGLLDTELVEYPRDHEINNFGNCLRALIKAWISR